MIRITNRLVLREFGADDWPAVLAYQSDPRYLRYNPWHQRTAEDVQRFVQRFIDWQFDVPRHKWQFAIILRDEDRLIGNCGLRRATADVPQADIGYELAPPYWGRGFATEAARELLDFGFSELKLHRITAQCIAENVASAHVLEKLGMRREGQLRDDQWIKGRWWDTLVYGILDHEWMQPAR